MGSSRELWYIFLDLHFYEIFTQIVHFWVDKYVWTWVYTYKWCGTSGIASVPSRVYFSGTLLILESVLREHLKPLHQLTTLLHYIAPNVLYSITRWFGLHHQPYSSAPSPPGTPPFVTSIFILDFTLSSKIFYFKQIFQRYRSVCSGKFTSCDTRVTPLCHVVHI